MANVIDEATAEKEFQEMLEKWKGFVRVPTVEMLKKMKYKVSLEKLFIPEEFERLSKLEKKRMKRINDRLSLMFAIGMPLPSENALRVKVGLLPHRKFVVKKDTDDDEDDETWKPSNPKTTKSFLLNRTEFAKRQRFILTKCMVSVDGGKTDAKQCKEEMSKLLGSWPKKMLEALNDIGDKPEKEKIQETKTSKRPSGVCCSPQRNIEKCLNFLHKVENSSTIFVKEIDVCQYSTRGIQKNYTEPAAPEDDHYLYCDICKKLYEGDCPTHGPYTEIPNTLVKWGLTDRARRTCPTGISIAPSKIRSGGLGVWADQDFARNSVFGPYEGVDVHRDDMQKKELIFDGGCAWEIYKKGQLSHYIDGSNLKKSNWLRYVNCASFQFQKSQLKVFSRNEDEQNVIAYQYKGEIYYRTYKDIRKGMEILVWYGQQYAEQLGITAKKVAQTKTPVFKVPESCFRCEKCGRLFADEAVFRRHIKIKHPDRSVVKRHKCEFCSYSSDNSGHLKGHLRVHTKEKPFQCTVCSKRFRKKEDLKQHIRIHAKECPYECSKCGKKFSRLGNMRYHVRTVHDKCKPFVCNVCGFTFGEAGSLISHMTTHTGVRNYKCRYCDKRFARSGTMQSHELIHTGEKPHKCKECSAAFIQSSSLRHHVITQHTKRYPYRCSICEKGFIYPGKLKKHESRCLS